MTTENMTHVEWITGCRYRLRELVRHEWGEHSSERLHWMIDDYLALRPVMDSMRTDVRAMSARLRELDPPQPVDRDNGVRWTGD